jgi:hypothetical protein
MNSPVCSPVITAKNRCGASLSAALLVGEYLDPSSDRKRPRRLRTSGGCPAPAPKASGTSPCRHGGLLQRCRTTRFFAVITTPSRLEIGLGLLATSVRMGAPVAGLQAGRDEARQRGAYDEARDHDRGNGLECVVGQRWDHQHRDDAPNATAFAIMKTIAAI